ncbi:rho GTPase-activating protein 44-like isoform X2 [Cloeon dipterum]|uniref:rho GTPase-activating protein 44-like isoform X2 n=1 Tax=Cloeon dipterum TaxID=197152 RepID=UPI00322076CF
MKKQFFRVKQLADQTFSRAGKTELLSDDLQEIDKHVEFLKNACINYSKKLSAYLLGQGADDASKEKRLKKCPEYQLGQAMKESAACDDAFMLKNILEKCGAIEVTLAHTYVEMDLQVEQSVVNPLQGVIDNDIPSIVKHKRNLAKLVLDMDAARTRYQTAVKHSNNMPGAKIESMREEMEEAQSKVDQCRDLLATEMYQLISKEAEITKYIAEHINIQKAYHERALRYLEEATSVLEGDLGDNVMRPVFGEALEEHLRVNKRKIAWPIELCVCSLLILGMEEEGLFRVAGGASKVRRMRMSLDANLLSLEGSLSYNDPAVVAGALKSYLRELPEPLMTFKLYTNWLNASKVPVAEERVRALKEVVELLPEANRDNLTYLIKFLATLCKNQEVNKMNPQNVAIVLAPNLIWSQQDAGNGLNMSTANVHSFIVDQLVSHAEDLFPGEMDFFVTIAKPEPLDMSVAPGGGRQTNGSGSKSSSSDQGHSRNSSADTLLITSTPDPAAVAAAAIKRAHSNSSLTDHSSPPASPKPLLRRKNKQAPVPPTPTPGAATQAAKAEKAERPPRPAQAPTPKEKPKEKAKSVEERPPLKEICPPKPTQRHSAELGADNNEKPAVAQKPRFPIAAPRTILNDDEKVRPVIAERPAIPERPASLRESFRAKSSEPVDDAPSPISQGAARFSPPATDPPCLAEGKGADLEARRHSDNHLSASESTDDEILEPERGKGGSFRVSKIARPTPPPPPPPSKTAADSTDL